MKNKKRYYVEFVPNKENEFYCLQSKWFTTPEKALEWFDNSFDYIDETIITAHIMIAVYVNEEDFDIYTYATIQGRKIYLQPNWKV